MAKKQKFFRSQIDRCSDLGKRRKKLWKYRKMKGCDNKIRLKMKGHLRNVSSGFRSEKKKRGLINDLKPVVIFNINDLKNLKKEELAIVAKVGYKRRKEIADYALKNNIFLKNLNPKKFLQEVELKIKEIKEIKEKRDEKKKIREKETKEIEKKEDKKVEEGKLEEKIEEKKGEEKIEEKNVKKKTKKTPGVENG